MGSRQGLAPCCSATGSGCTARASERARKQHGSPCCHAAVPQLSPAVKTSHLPLKNVGFYVCFNRMSLVLLISTRMPAWPCVALEGRASDRWGSQGAALLPPALMHCFIPHHWGKNLSPPAPSTNNPARLAFPRALLGHPTCKSGCCPRSAVEELVFQLTSKTRGNPSGPVRFKGSKPGASSNRKLKMFCFKFIAAIRSLSTPILQSNIDLIMD